MNVDVFFAGTGIGVLLVIVRTLEGLSQAAGTVPNPPGWRRALVTFPMGAVGFVSIPLMVVGLAFGCALSVVADIVHSAAERKFPSVPIGVKQISGSVDD